MTEFSPVRHWPEILMHVVWWSHWAILYYWRTCSASKSVAKNMADFGLCWHQNDAIWFLRLMVITTDQAQFWARYDFHTPLVLIKIFFLVDVFAVYSRSFLFFHIFWTFDHWFKCVQVVYIILSSSKDRKPRNTSAKTIFEAATTGKIFLSS
jgi:hypothetical protein